MLRQAAACPRAWARARGPLLALQKCSAAPPAVVTSSRWSSSAAAVAAHDVASPADSQSSGKRLIKMEGRTVRKEFILSRMDHVFGSAKMIAVLQHNSLSVSELASLRLTLGAKNVKVTMFPNTLARRALKGTPLEALSPLFHSSSLVMYAAEPILKDVSDVVKKNPKLHLLGVHVEGMVLDSEGVKRFLSMPSMEQLHGELLAVINQPARLLASMLQRGSSDLVFALQRYVDEKNSPKEEGQGDAAPPAAE